MRYQQNLLSCRTSRSVKREDPTDDNTNEVILVDNEIYENSNYDGGKDNEMTMVDNEVYEDSNIQLNSEAKQANMMTSNEAVEDILHVHVYQDIN